MVLCVIVLALSSFVSAIPHEYGAKTGAIAKAEANAVAGSLGVLPAIPLSIPSGAGFSGSFSKSSSSSFASSSSSSSSSSYSFSGNNGIPGVGCLSGTCKTAPSNIPSSFNGSPNTQIMHHSSEASALAAAKASSESLYFNSGSNVPCQAGNCLELNGSTKCKTGQCDRSSDISSSGGNDSGIQKINSENTQKCLSGICFPMSDNDFEVKFDKNSKISNPTGSSSSPEKISPNCNSPSCDTFLPLTPSTDSQSFNPEKPVDHLVTPNLRPTCTTHNCNTDSIVSNENNGKPSSYNVPILGMNPSFQQNLAYNPSIVPLSNIPSQTGLEANCGSNDCTYNNAQANTGSVGTKIPKYFFSNYPATPNSATNNPSSCNSPNCGKFPVPNQTNNLGWSNTVKPNFNPSSINHNGPTYNNMFGGAIDSTTKYPGLPNTVKPNNYANQNVQYYSEGFGGSKGSINTAVYPGLTGTTKPNLITVSNNQNAPKYTNGFGGPPGPVDAAVYPGTHIAVKPISNIASTESNLPLYTGGFGGPSGSVTAAVPAGFFTTIKPNGSIKPHESVYNGGPTEPIRPTSTIQHNNVVIPSDNTNVLQNPVDEKAKLPPYTGGFGGPPGMLKPNEYVIPSKLNSPIPVMPCTTIDCSKKSVSNENYNKAEASATALANSGGVYSGGFGAPSGLLQPENNKNSNSNTNFNDVNKNNQLNNENTQSGYIAGNQENTDVKKTAENDYTALNDFNKHTNIAGTHSPGSQNNVAGNSPVVKENVPNNSEKEKAFNDYIQQANIAGAFASAGAQSNVGGTSPSVNNNKYDTSDKNKMLDDYFSQANIAGAFASAGAQSSVGGTSPSANNNKYDTSDKNKMLDDYFAQANIANAVASAGASAGALANVADQDNFVALTGSNSNQNSGCNINCRPNANSDVVAGASARALASAKSISNAGSWATGQSFASGAATAHAVAGAAVKGGYGRR